MRFEHVVKLVNFLTIKVQCRCNFSVTLLLCVLVQIYNTNYFERGWRCTTLELDCRMPGKQLQQSKHMAGTQSIRCYVNTTDCIEYMTDNFQSAGPSSACSITHNREGTQQSSCTAGCASVNSERNEATVSLTLKASLS